MTAIESRLLRTAVIGCGRVGELHAAALAAAPGSKLVAVCDVSHERSRRLAERYEATPCEDVRELLRKERPDVVTIATPDDRHVEPVLAALEAGCHVFCEKPLATSLDDARTLVAAADRSGRSLGVDFNRRYGFAYRRAEQRLRGGHIGRPRNIVLQVTDGFPREHVRTTATFMFTTLLTHHFDLVEWLIAPIRSLSVTGTLDPGTKLLSNVVIAMRFEGDAVGAISASYEHGQSRTYETMTIVGDRGRRLVVEDVTASLCEIGGDRGCRETWRPEEGDPTGSFWSTIGVHVTDFLSSVASDQAPKVTGQAGLRSLQIAAAASQSWETGLPQELTAELAAGVADAG